MGKVDRRALPEPGNLKREATKGFAPAADELELKLTRIWEQVLNVHPIGTDENFFELGGHSLLAVKLFAHIDTTWGGSALSRMWWRRPTM